MRPQKVTDPTNLPKSVASVMDQPSGQLEPGLQFDRLPESSRRRQRFGNEGIAGHAEAVALRREIDAVAGRVAAWIAAEQNNRAQRALLQGGTSAVRQDREAVLQLTWVHLRRAGLALRAEIDRHEIKQQERDRPNTDRSGTDQSQAHKPVSVMDPGAAQSGGGA